MIDIAAGLISSVWQADSYVQAQLLFLRLMGIIYAIAFWSILIQAKGLWGKDGILPVEMLLAQFRRLGPKRFYYLPTLFWLNSSDAALVLAAVSGIILGLLLALGVLPGAMPVLALVMLYVLYLSYKSVGQDFLNFQWDALLLEVGFASILVAAAPSAMTALLLWFILFKFMFMAGAVKLRSGDPSWRNLSAMSYHYQTQPLPNPLSWHAHNLPAGYHRMEVLGTFFIELVVPLLIFGTAETRLLAFACFIALQLLIMLGGNYGPFNLISMVMAVPLLHDSVLSSLGLPVPAPLLPQLMVDIIALSLVILSALHILSLRLSRLPGLGILRALEPFEISNGYGLFAVMTTQRHEIIVEWSYNGKKWAEYGFRWKPQALGRLPPLSMPHMPRLDWLMWFLPFSSVNFYPWFLRFMEKLLKNSPDVLALLGSGPSDPPKYVRAIAYDYKFTDPETRKRTGRWWTREKVGVYCPPLSVLDF